MYWLDILFLGSYVFGLQRQICVVCKIVFKSFHPRVPGCTLIIKFFLRTPWEIISEGKNIKFIRDLEFILSDKL